MEITWSLEPTAARPQLWPPCSLPRPSPRTPMYPWHPDAVSLLTDSKYPLPLSLASPAPPAAREPPMGPSSYALKPQLPVACNSVLSQSCLSPCFRLSRCTDSIDVLCAGPERSPLCALSAWFPVPEIPFPVSFLHIHLLPICQGPGSAPPLPCTPWRLEALSPLLKVQGAKSALLLPPSDVEPLALGPGTEQVPTNVCGRNDRVPCSTPHQLSLATVRLAIAGRFLLSHAVLSFHQSQPAQTSIYPFRVYQLLSALPHPQNRRLPTTLKASAPHLQSGHLAFPSSYLPEKTLPVPWVSGTLRPTLRPTIYLRYSSLWLEGRTHTPVRRVLRRRGVGAGGCECP